MRAVFGSFGIPFRILTFAKLFSTICRISCVMWSSLNKKTVEDPMNPKLFWHFKTIEPEIKCFLWESRPEKMTVIMWLVLNAFLKYFIKYYLFYGQYFIACSLSNVCEVRRWDFEFSKILSRRKISLCINSLEGKSYSNII